jgi:HlyD family secretion protein
MPVIHDNASCRAHASPAPARRAPGPQPGGPEVPGTFQNAARRAPAAVALALALAALAGCGSKDSAVDAIAVEPVERRTITLTVNATGTVEPVDLVEVKSKASGQIIRMPVEVGSVVRPGDLLAQIDKVDVQNAYDQAVAALEAARIRAKVSASQKARADDLLASGVITTQEYESAELDDANAKSALVQARTNLDNARQRLEDATVRAPIAGTVLAQPVAVGQVISSATASVSGGTTLLLMADLSRIRMRVLVPESDIGNLSPGRTATVQMDAYPNRPFRGEIEKIEPQAVVQQSVTMFPVLVSLTNEDGLLLPGMNGEVNILIARRENVLAVPVDALRTIRDAGAMAMAMGFDPETLSARVQSQTAALMAAAAGGDTARVGAAPRGAGARGAQMTRGSGAARGAAAGSARGGAAAWRAGGGSNAGRGAAPQVAFVQTANGVMEPRAVRVGVSDFEYTEVMAGLEEGEQVALLGVAEIQAQRTQLTDRMRSRMGAGLTTQTGGSASGGTGTGGGTRGGGR